MMKRTRELFVTGLAAVAAMPLLGVPAQAASALPAEQEYAWGWSDGSTAEYRVFRQSRFGSARNLPEILVEADPAYPRRTARLQWYSKRSGTWRTEDTASTSATGLARLQVDPWCGRNDWCDGVYRYRVTIAGSYEDMRIRFVSR